MDRYDSTHLSLPRNSTEGEVVFQHIWLTTSAAGIVPRPQISPWYPVKVTMLVLWILVAIAMMLGYEGISVLKFCTFTMFTGLASCLPNRQKRKREF